jgi:hypothetical protein
LGWRRGERRPGQSLLEEPDDPLDPVELPEDPVEPPDDSPLVEVLLLDESDDADPVVPLFDPRWSVLKNPEPLNVTPTGVNTLRTGNTSPESGWASSVRLSSWKPYWTSIVSPVSTNL